MNSRLSHALGHGLAITLLAGALAACGTDQRSDADTTAADAEASSASGQEADEAVAPASEQPAVVPRAEPEAADAFALDKVPVSTVPLGKFPYFSIPEGYTEGAPRNVSRLDFAEAAFWTGDRHEIVEGKVYATGIRVKSGSGKQFSSLEVARNLEHVISAADGVEVVSGELPREMRKDKAIESLMRQYDTEARCRAHDPIQIFVVRRPDATIWVRTCQSQHFAGLIVAEEEAFIATSKLLPADELRQQLDTAGKVAVEVNFAVDKADILPDSQPQIEQVLQLMLQDPALRLSVNGHTDNTGGAEHNQRLSEARARAVVADLHARGVDAGRLQARGFGQSQPVADNTTEEGKAMNRRVELVRLQ